MIRVVSNVNPNCDALFNESRINAFFGKPIIEGCKILTGSNF